ncbi:hypothetical protein ZIOFF_013416 [Zingiber officinale]|uniref:Uncharacterized protein n=1 Tax=Zingiber officinale TaxID=94328 RepID=A0A8J5H946_ZINOF|nr:hypothetical protein ZIOFF_013416 [Zingiber officinale]
MAEEEALKKNIDCIYFLASALTCKRQPALGHRGGDLWWVDIAPCGRDPGQRRREGTAIGSGVPLAGDRQCLSLPLLAEILLVRPAVFWHSVGTRAQLDQALGCDETKWQRRPGQWLLTVERW